MTDRAAYSMLIEWSEEDRAYVVTLPEWAGRVAMPVTHGEIYEEAARNGAEALRLLTKSVLQEGDELPQARAVAAPVPEPATV